jgi:hypothetical protein
MRLFMLGESLSDGEYLTLAHTVEASFLASLILAGLPDMRCLMGT